MQFDILYLWATQTKRGAVFYRQNNNFDTGRSIYPKMGLSMPQGRVEKYGDLGLESWFSGRLRKSSERGFKKSKTRDGLDLYEKFN